MILIDTIIMNNFWAFITITAIFKKSIVFLKIAVIILKKQYTWFSNNRLDDLITGIFKKV